MVVVDGEHEAEPLDSRLVLGADDDGAVGALPRVRDLILERAREHPVEERPRRVVREPRRQRERIRTTGANLHLEHAAMMTRAMDTLA